MLRRSSTASSSSRVRSTSSRTRRRSEWRTFRPDQDQHLEEFKKKAPASDPQADSSSRSRGRTRRTSAEDDPRSRTAGSFGSTPRAASGRRGGRRCSWRSTRKSSGTAGTTRCRPGSPTADRRTQTGKVKSGKFMWSATPQSGTVQLFDLYSRAMDEAEARQALIEHGQKPGPATIEVFHFGIDTTRSWPPTQRRP